MTLLTGNECEYRYCYGVVIFKSILIQNENEMIRKFFLIPLKILE